MIRWSGRDRHRHPDHHGWLTVTPTIMDGTVVRWYAGEDAEDRGEELASASRNRVVWVKGPDTLYHHVHEVHRTLRHDRRADLSYLATHRRDRLFGPLVPVRKP